MAQITISYPEIISIIRKYENKLPVEILEMRIVGNRLVIIIIIIKGIKIKVELSFLSYSHGSLIFNYSANSFVKVVKYLFKKKIPKELIITRDTMEYKLNSLLYSKYRMMVSSIVMRNQHTFLIDVKL